MIHDLVGDPVVLEGVVQVAVAAVLAVAVLGLTRFQRLDLEGELAGALVRGLVQVVAMGAVLGLLLTVPLPLSFLVLAGMMLGAAWLSRDRAPGGLPEAFRVSLAAVAVGSGATIVLMTLAGAIRPEVRNLVPVGSMVIVASMRTHSLVLDRLGGEVEAHRDRIEAGLALGAPGSAVLRAHLRRSVRASLLPVVDSLRSLGLVWIPGLMAGMVLAGANPLYAALYQFVIMAMIFSAAGLTAVAGAILAGTRVLTEAEQLRELDAS